MITKVFNTQFGNLGRRGTSVTNELTSIDGVILVSHDFTPTIEDATLEATWVTGIRRGQVFPLVGLDNYENQSTEDTMYESPIRGRKMTKRGKTRYMFQFDCPLATHKALHKFYHNADLRYVPIRDGKICFFAKDGKFHGFGTSMINIGRMTELPSDGSTPASTPVFIDLKNYREWDEFGEVLAPDWMVEALEPLVDVELKVVSASATSVVIKVFAADGFDETGAVKEVAIRGIDEDDWNNTFGASTAYTDNADGTYTFAGTAFTAGEANLKAPHEMVSEGLLIASAGEIDVTIA